MKGGDYMSKLYIIQHPECALQYYVNSDGIVFNDQQKEIKQYESTNGFNYVPLMTLKYGLQLLSVDEIVLEAFTKRPIGCNCVIHKDRNLRNNKLENLMWDFAEEQWTIICDHNYVKEYKISNFGGFKIGNKYPVLYPNDRGYYCVRLKSETGVIHKTIHRLVAEYFVTNPDKLKFNEINHINGNKTDNYWKNLEWVNHDINMKHAHMMNMVKHECGEKLSISILSDSTVHEICKLFIKFYGRSESVYNYIRKDHPEITLKMIQHIKHKECWSHISDKYWSQTDLSELNTLKIRKICESLLNNHGDVTMTYNDLISVIPDLTKRFIYIIKYKETYASISDEYFYKGEFMINPPDQIIQLITESLYRNFMNEDIVFNELMSTKCPVTKYQIRNIKSMILKK